jgi:hypothetical protein
MPSTTKSIPITVFTGFLGSGKYTEHSFFSCEL